MPQMMGGADAQAGRIKATDPRVKRVTDRIGRGYRPNRDVQAEQAARGGLSAADEAAAQDDFARRLSGGADAQAGKVRPTPAAVRGRGQVQLAWDDEPGKYGWHYSPAENATGIREGGLDPSHAGRHGPAARGVHFSDSPDTYRPIGDQDYNVYRVPREHIPDPAHVSTDDFYTTQKIAPEHVQVYEGPGKFGTLAGHVGTAATVGGLVNMLSSFLGGPYIQGPSDMVLNDLIRQAYAPGGGMDPYRDYQGPRDPKTGDILA